MEKKLLNSMFENLLHIGNKSNYWNPKMKNYIYGSVNGIHVIDLTKTAKKIEEVTAELKKIHSEGKKILFVATKLQSRDAFINLAETTGHYYVAEKWVPGLLTNFKTIKTRIATYLKLLKDSETGAFNILTKKETAAKMLELEKLHKAFRGLKEMKKIPDVLFIVDGVYEKQAVKEARILKIKSYAILNTNGDDTLVDNCIPANTNSVKSIEFIANKIKDELAGVKVKNTGNTGNAGKIIKMDKEKISGIKKNNAKKVEKKEEKAEKTKEKTEKTKEEAKKIETSKKTTAKKVEKKEEK